MKHSPAGDQHFGSLNMNHLSTYSYKKELQPFKKHSRSFLAHHANEWMNKWMKVTSLIDKHQTKAICKLYSINKYKTDTLITASTDDGYVFGICITHTGLHKHGINGLTIRSAYRSYYYYHKTKTITHYPTWQTWLSASHRAVKCFSFISPNGRLRSLLSLKFKTCRLGMRPISSGMLDKLFVHNERIVSRKQLPNCKQQFNHT